MENQMEFTAYEKARKKVKNIKSFYTSLVFYIIFISALAALNYYTNQLEYAWFLWAAFGWGIGLIFQAIKVFQWNALFGKDWEERKMKQFMEEENKKSTLS